jgi:hypothetical protein
MRSEAQRNTVPHGATQRGAAPHRNSTVQNQTARNGTAQRQYKTDTAPAPQPKNRGALVWVGRTFHPKGAAAPLETPQKQKPKLPVTRVWLCMDTVLNIRIPNSLAARLLERKLATDVPTSIFVRKCIERVLADEQKKAAEPNGTT